jgi:SAM-dependent methyltransferase
MTSTRSLLVDPPATPPKLEDCNFYHSIDLPGVGLQVGSWDLRGHFDEYFGGHNFVGERVLDLGTASGALAFEMERRGAREVIGFDLDEGFTYDCRLPIDEAVRAEFRDGVNRIKNGFWLARHALGSQVNVVYGHVSNLPAGLGQFDTVMMGNILQHLQDPVGAVLQAIQHTGHIIITEADWLPGFGDDLPCMLMYDIANPFSWYQVKPLLLQNLLRRWDFTEQTLNWHTQVILEGHQFKEGGEVSWEQFGLPTRHFTLSARKKT